MNPTSGEGGIGLGKIDRSNFDAPDRARKPGRPQDARREWKSAASKGGFDGVETEIAGDKDGGNIS